ncbi:class I SAM-dependent methyltransferase [Corynebacterium nuruki]|uniref:class I SAM-dependent methyltransferase n=1 Tax=Corynebacterium nuruki TaxID=1032851 RepID=UPI00024871FC|nr:class I SAM-dependent methyltransferase [Corynebacterium nuruki]
MRRAGTRGHGDATSLPTLRRRATLRRSLGLLADFRFEQSDPDRFYGHLAADTVGLLSDIWADAGDTASPRATSHGTTPLAGTRILDVGGGPGYFGRAFATAGVDNYVTCEPDVGEMAAAGIRLASSVRGSGMDLPFADKAFDLTYSSNVAEHVCDPWRMADEMLRVTRPGGLVVFSYTCWLGPFGGHETGLWQHYVGGEFAARRYEKKHGRPPKNRWGESLFNVSCADGLHYAAALPDRQDSPDAVTDTAPAAPDPDHPYPAELVAAFPRYHPWWAWWLTRVPGLREVGVSNLVLVLRRR